MNPKASINKGNKKIISEINNYCDSQVNENEQDDKIDLKVVNVQNPIQVVSQNAKKEEKVSDIVFNNNTTNGLTIPSINVDQDESIKTNNLMKDSFIIVMIILKKYLKKKYKLNIINFNCALVLGIGITHMKRVLNLKIYQILSYYPKYMIQIIKVIKDPKISKKNKLLFFYLMTRTYEELYIRYVKGDINFQIDKGLTLRIPQIATLNKVLKQKEKELQKKNKSSQFIKKSIEAFKNVSENMINNIKNGELERKPRNNKEEKPFIVFELEEFEKMRKHFDETNKAN